MRFYSLKLHNTSDEIPFPVKFKISIFIFLTKILVSVPNTTKVLISIPVCFSLVSVLASNTENAHRKTNVVRYISAWPCTCRCYIRGVQPPPLHHLPCRCFYYIIIYRLGINNVLTMLIKVPMRGCSQNGLWVILLTLPSSRGYDLWLSALSQFNSINYTKPSATYQFKFFKYTPVYLCMFTEVIWGSVQHERNSVGHFH